MRLKHFFLVFILLFFIVILFFVKPISRSSSFFPGDLLVSEYFPWRSYSYLGYNPGSIPNKAQYFDTIRQIYPWKTYSVNVLKSGEIPLWDPYNFSGSPLLANFQSSVFYPPNVLYFVFSQITAWNILIFLELFLSLLFSYLYAKKIGFGFFASFFTSVSFSFSLFVITWFEYNTIIHALLWFPLILYAVENLFEKVTKRWSFALIFSISASAFAGHFQIFGYVFIFSIFYLLFKSFEKKEKKFGKSIFILLLFILALGIASLQLVPGLELISNSARVHHSYDFITKKLLIQPLEIFMFFVPDFLGNPATRTSWASSSYIGKVTSIGSVPLFFLVLSIFLKKTKVIKFLAYESAAIIFLVTINPFSSLLYKVNVPFISSSNPTFLVSILSFNLSVIAGFGLDYFIKNKITFKKFFISIFPLFLIFISSFIIIFIMQKSKAMLYDYFLVSSRAFLFSFGVFAIAVLLIGVVNIKRQFLYSVLIILFMLHIGSQWKLFDKFNPVSNKQLVFPETQVFDYLKSVSGINRIWGYGSGYLESNFETQYSIFSPNGYDPLYIKRYGEFVQGSNRGKIDEEFTVFNRSDAVVAKGYGKEDLKSNEHRLKVLDFLGVKYFLSTNTDGFSSFTDSRFKLIFEKNGIQVYENSKALPRAIFVSDYKTFKTKEEFVKIFFSKEFDPEKTVLLEKNINFKKEKNIASSEIKLIQYESNDVSYEVKNGKEGVFFLSDVYYPGWKVFVDNKQKELLRTDYAFRGVVLEKGEHGVHFKYDPFSFKLAKTIFLISLIFTLFILLFTKKIQKYFKAREK